MSQRHGESQCTLHIQSLDNICHELLQSLQIFSWPFLMNPVSRPLEHGIAAMGRACNEMLHILHIHGATEFSLGGQ